jgi:hypothetical protein
MDLAAIIRAVVDIGSDAPNRAALSLRPGDLLTGQVVQLERNGQVLMDFGRFRARVQFDRAVQPGHSIPFEVVESGTPLKLRVRPAVGESANPPLPRLDIRRAVTSTDHKRLLGLMDRLVKPGNALAGKGPLPDPISNALGQLKTLLQPIPIPTKQHLDPLVGRLQAAIDGSGLFFEKAMAEAEIGNGLSAPQPGKGTGLPFRPVLANDLKAQLLLLKAFFSGAQEQAQALADLSARELSFFKKCLEQLTTHLQDQQGRLVRRLEGNDPLLAVTHHLYVEDQRQPVKLRIHYPRKERSDRGRGVERLAMLLKMDRLGPVRIDMVASGDALDVGFFVQSETVRQGLEAAAERVKEALGKIYDRVRIVTRISEQKIAQFDQGAASGSGGKMIDIQI